MTPTHPNRRDFVRTLALGSLTVGTGASLSGCEAGGFGFLHGVASGDPLTDRVMLWTRVTPDAARLDAIAGLERSAATQAEARQGLEQARRVPVLWQVALDPDFRRVVARGTALALPQCDHTVKVDAGGLHAGTAYWYRFECLGVTSPSGRTRTLPRGGVEQVRLAVFSRSNYLAGYFNVYGAAARLAGVDATLHLGDDLYEYAKDGYASGGAEQLGRVSQPAGELLTLADYRSDRQLALAGYVGSTGFDAARFMADLADPSRQLLGTDQHTWLNTRLARSNALWQVLGQQVLMGRMNVPLPLLLGQISVSGYAALVARAQRDPASLTPQEQALLAGDTHNAWASDLADAQGNAVGVEFATPSVSSPGFEAIFTNDDPRMLAAALQQMIGPLVYAGTSWRGWLTITATRSELQAQWSYVERSTPSPLSREAPWP